MAVRRRAADDSADSPSEAVIPDELCDHADPCWRDAQLYREWCEQHLPAGQAPDRSQDVRDPDLPAVSWTSRFRRARDGWARANGVVTGPGRWPRRDDVRLARMGSAPLADVEMWGSVCADPPVDVPAKRAREARTEEECEVARMGWPREWAVQRVVEREQRWAAHVAVLRGRSR